MRFINIRLLCAWLLGIPLSYYTLGFLSNFYSTRIEITLLTPLFHTGVSMFFYYILGRAWRQFQYNKTDFGLTAALFVILFLFTAGIFKMARQFNSLFDTSYFQLGTDQLVYFAAALLPALPSSVWLLSPDRQKKIKQTLFFKFVEDNLPGLMAAVFFFSTYLILASIFNRPVFDVDDIFFDTDGLLWRTRFTTAAYQDYYWRSVHPFVLLIIRPLITLLAFLLKGDKLSAAFVLAAFSGSLCVFLAWVFIKQTTTKPLYALLTSALLGASAAHLVFGSLIETYIFLAAAAMIFLVMLLRDKPQFMLILAGTVSFGITITNFAQTVIAYIFVKRNFLQWVKYGLAVGALVIPLTLLNNFIYPNSQPYFFDPTSLSTEADNTFTPSVERGMAVARVMLFHSIVAPDPLILEEEIPFLKVWIFKAAPMRLSKYATILGTVLAYLWLGLLLAGGFLFLKNIKRDDNRFPLAFIFILLFNFALHLRYGKDIFLYSANWTYAIILFLVLAWKDLAVKRWFQIILLAFLALLLVNNSRLIFAMLSTSALHIK